MIHVTICMLRFKLKFLLIYSIVIVFIFLHNYFSFTKFVKLYNFIMQLFVKLCYCTCSLLILTWLSLLEQCPGKHVISYTLLESCLKSSQWRWFGVLQLALQIWKMWDDGKKKKGWIRIENLYLCRQIWMMCIVKIMLNWLIKFLTLHLF